VRWSLLQSWVNPSQAEVVGIALRMKQRPRNVIVAIQAQFFRRVRAEPVMRLTSRSSLF
jgi:hypothetical protein